MQTPVAPPSPARLPVVSVIIPTWNGAKLLPHAIRSILAQEGAGELFEIELIVIDDCSPDDTPDVVRQFPEVRYHRLPANRGLSGARNAGLAHVTGDYIAYLDDDDLWLPYKLRMQVPLLEAHPEAGALFGQNIVSFRDRVTIWPDANTPSGRIFERLLMGNLVPVRTVLIRRAAHEEIGGFDTSLGSYEANDLFLRLAFRYPFIFQPGPVAIYRRLDSGLYIGGIQEGKAERDAAVVIEKALALLPDDAAHAELRRKARAAVALGYAWELWDVKLWERLADQVVTIVGTWPGLAAGEWRGTISRMLVKCATESADPVAALAALEGRVATKDARLWGDAWSALAAALAAARPRRAGAAAAAMRRAVRHRPFLLRRRRTLALLATPLRRPG